MYKNLDTENDFTISKDDTYQQELRTIASLPDFDRVPEDRFLDRFYASLSDDKPPTNRVLPHSDLFYCRAALEAKFPDRKFTMDEVRALIEEIYNVTYTWLYSKNA